MCPNFSSNLKQRIICYNSSIFGNVRDVFKEVSFQYKVVLIVNNDLKIIDNVRTHKNNICLLVNNGLPCLR